ncbi:hypothetical protein OC834_007310 [Tilletia horrida]|nr:hypothetical protein OC834_007310 [Tilletia horrida]
MSGNEPSDSQPQAENPSSSLSEPPPITEASAGTQPEATATSPVDPGLQQPGTEGAASPPVSETSTTRAFREELQKEMEANIEQAFERRFKPEMHATIKEVISPSLDKIFDRLDGIDRAALSTRQYMMQEMKTLGTRNTYVQEELGKIEHKIGAISERVEVLEGNTTQPTDTAGLVSPPTGVPLASADTRAATGARTVAQAGVQQTPTTKEEEPIPPGLEPYRHPISSTPYAARVQQVGQSSQDVRNVLLQDQSSAEKRPQQPMQGRSLADQMNDPNIDVSVKVSALRADQGVPSHLQTSKSAEDNLWRMEWRRIKAEQKGANSQQLFEATEKAVNETMVEIAKSAVTGHVTRVVKDSESKTDDDDGFTSAKHEKDNRVLVNNAYNRIPTLTVSNYNAWKNGIINFFQSFPGAVEHILLEEYDVGMNPNDPNRSSSGYNKRLDLDVGGLMAMTIDNKLQVVIIDPLKRAKQYTASRYFQAVSQYLLRKSAGQRELIKTQIRRSVQKPNETVQSYAARLATLYSRLCDAGGEDHIHEEEKISHLLRSIDAKYEQVINAIKVMRFFGPQSGQAKFDDILVFLQTMEEDAALSALDGAQATTRSLARVSAVSAALPDSQSHTTGTEPNTSALRTKAALDDFTTKYLANDVRIQSTSRSNGPTKQTTTYFKGKCRYCQQWGHMARDCNKRKSDIDSGALQGDDLNKAKAMAFEIEDEEESDEIAATSMALLDLGD